METEGDFDITSLFPELHEALTVGVLVADASGKIIASNGELCDILRLSSDASELLGRDTSFVTDEVGGFVGDSGQFLQEGVKTEEQQYSITTDHLQLTNGRTLKQTRIRTHQIERVERIWLYREETESANREERLQMNERRFEAVFEDPQMLASLLTIDGTIVRSNQTAIDFIEGDMEELIGTPFWKAPWWPSEMERDVHGWVERAAAGEYVEYEVDHTGSETRDYTSRGTIRPVKDDDGTVVSLIVSARDITERTRRETALDELQEVAQEFMNARGRDAIARLAVETTESVLDQPFAGVWLHDDETDALKPAAVSDAGATLFDELPTYSGEENPAWQVFTSGECRVRNDLQNESGSYLSGSLVGSEMLLPLGEYGILSIWAKELSAFTELETSLANLLTNTVKAALARSEREQELRNQRRNLKQQNERLEEFASIVSHDLRNPLQVLAGLLDDADAINDPQGYERGQRAIERMETLVDDLLTLAREGSDVTQVEIVSLAEIADACWQHTQTTTATLVVNTDSRVLADPGRLKQLFENLFENAVSYGGSDVTVTVSDLENGFSIADDGPGIPSDKRKKVFDRTYSTSASGIGLGLAIVAEIVDAHGWDLSLAESSTGGVQFEITGVEFPPR